jgi:hypothetical protein
MVDCLSGPQHTIDELEAGDLQATWPEDATLADFLCTRFPLGDNPIFADDKNFEGLSQSCKALRATSLQGRARLGFRPTEDMTRHLYLDRKTWTVEIFHHTSFLKEHLLMSKPGPSRDGNEYVTPHELPELSLWAGAMLML